MPIRPFAPLGALSRVRRWLRGDAIREAVPVLALVSLFTVTGVRGVDFGHHWDEVDWQIRPVREMVSSGLLMPRAAIYPAFSKWLVLLPVLPSGVRAALAKESTPEKVQEAMVKVIDDPGYLLRARRLFVLVSALAIVWVYCASRAFGRPRWEAFVAAASLGLSWELAYHARWVATDCIVVMWAALTAFMLALYFRSRSLRWLYASAVAAGFGAGTKYPAVVLLVPVFVASLGSLPRRDLARQAARLAALTGAALLAYLVTTPATLYEPLAFIKEYQWISGNYSRGHWGYSASSGFDHAKLALLYLAWAFFSPFWPVALVLFGAAILGAGVWIRSDRRAAIALVSFPIAFLVIYCFKYRAVIVRNYLLVTPFLALMTARGVGEIVARLRHPVGRWSIAAGLAAVAIAQAGWLIRSAESIHRPDPKRDVRKAISYVKAHPKVRYRLSARVRSLATEQGLRIPDNVAGGEAGAVVFYARDEGPADTEWKSNDPWLTEAVFGPREINFNWYSSWRGADRIVVMEMKKAKATGVPLAR